MTRQFKTVRASIKAAPASVDAAQGYFDALVSVFDTEDLVGDIVEQGAFDKAVKAWQDSGDPVPVVWSHQWDDPMAHIGWVDPKNIRVTERGLEVKDAVIDLDTDYAKQVHKLLVNRRVKEFSFAYDAKDYVYDQRDVRHLKELDFFEIGPTLKGAHPDTELIGAKGSKAVDTGSWDGDAAMRSCDTAAEFRRIAFERDNDSDPDSAAHWALPHHSEPGAPANARGVAAAVGALHGARGGAPDLVNPDAAEAHLAAHQREIENAKGVLALATKDGGDPPPADPDPEGGTPPAEPDQDANDADDSGVGEGSASGDSETLVLGDERLDDKSHDVVMAYALRHGKVVADETIAALGEARAAVDAVLASLEEGKSTDGAQQPAGDDAAGTDETEQRLRLLSL
jgi:hypothetical protein